ncbi:MAG: hypothetical protein NE334_11570 [Lentisphaeraceae bacterium]|nr:hypothetical protein [Lentisphaeraceae bacterium]
MKKIIIFGANIILISVLLIIANPDEELTEKSSVTTRKSTAQKIDSKTQKNYRKNPLGFDAGPGESDEEKEQSRISHPGPGESDEERQQSLALRPGPGESDEEKEKSHILHPGPGESE